MLQRNSFFNYFNQVIALKKYNDAVSGKLLLNNATIYLNLPKKTFWDDYNNVGTFIKSTRTVYKNISKRFFYNHFFIQWARVVFKGKSYRIRNFKHNNKFTFNFGYSHWTKLKLLTNWQCFKRKRQNHMVFTYNLKDYEYFRRFLPYIRFMNCYTLRGLRLKR